MSLNLSELENDVFENETIWLSVEQTKDFINGLTYYEININSQQSTLCITSKQYNHLFSRWLSNIPFISSKQLEQKAYGHVPDGLKIPRGVRSFANRDELNLRNIESLHSLIKLKREIQQQVVSVFGKNLGKIVQEYAVF